MNCSLTSPHIQNNFIKFYSNVVEINNDALYARERMEELSASKEDDKQRKEKDKKEKERKDKERKRHDAMILATEMGERGKPRRKRQEYYQGAYCIFHEMYGHDSTYCGNTDYTMEYKRNQVRKSDMWF